MVSLFGLLIQAGSYLKKELPSVHIRSYAAELHYHLWIFSSLVVDPKEVVWISIVITVTILALLAAIATTFVCVIRKRKQSLLSLHYDSATAAKSDYPIYEEVSPIEILLWYAEAVRLGDVTVDGGTHQYEMPITDSTNIGGGEETDIASAIDSGDD